MSKATDLMNDLYTHVDVEMTIRERICGGIPKSKDLIRKWQEACGGTPDQAEKIIADMEEGQAIEEKIDSCWTGFKCDEQGLYIEDRQIKAMIRESASVLGIFVKERGSKQIQQHGLFIRPPRVHLGMKEPSGYEEAVCHITGPTGKRSALKRFDYAEKCSLSFRIDLLKRWDDKQMLTVDLLHLILTHCQDDGLGSNRSQGYGTFDLVKFEVVK